MVRYYEPYEGPKHHEAPKHHEGPKHPKHHEKPSSAENIHKHAENPYLKKILNKSVLTPELNHYTKEQEEQLRLILKGKKETHEGVNEKVHEQQVKDQIVDRVLKTKYGLFYKKAIENGQTPKEIRDKYLKKSEDFLATKVEIKTKDGKQITKTRYEAIINKNKDLLKLNTKENPKFTKEILTVYGTDTVKQFNSLIQEAGKRGEKLPANLEEFDKFIKRKIVEKQIDELKKEDPEKGVDKKAIRRQVEHAIGSNPNYVKSALSHYSTEGKDYNFEKGTHIANKQALDDAINSLPEGSKARLLLTNAEKYLGLSEKKPADREKLKNLLGFDPATTPWCKGFFNAIAKESGIQLNSAGNLGALSGQSDGRKLDLNKEKPMPGDAVVLRRKGTTSAGTPGGHIGIFIGMSKNGYPLIIGGNQGKFGEVSIREERRHIVSINRLIPQEEEKKDKQYMEEHNKHGN